MSIKPLEYSSSPEFGNCYQLEIYEYESFNPAVGWMSDIAEASDFPTKFSDEERSIRTIYASVDDIACPTGYQFVGNWKIHRGNGDVDVEGWMYASAFNLFNGESASEMSSESMARRRKWYRNIQETVSVEAGIEINPEINVSEESHEVAVSAFSSIVTI